MTRRTRIKNRFCVAIIAAILPAVLMASTVDIYPRMAAREKVYTEFHEVAYALSNIEMRHALAAWQAMSRNKDNYPQFHRFWSEASPVLRRNIKNRDILTLALHYYYVGDFENFKAAILFYHHNVAVFLLEYAENPFYKDSYLAPRALRDFNKIERAISELEICLDRIDLTMDERFPGRVIRNLYLKCLEDPPSARDLEDARSTAFGIIMSPDYVGAPHVSSYSGFIPGNYIELLTHNDYGFTHPDGFNMITYLGELNHRVKHTRNRVSGQKYVNMSVEDFSRAMPDRRSAIEAMFSSEEGFPNEFNSQSPDFHRVYAPLVGFNQAQNIFGEVYSAISGAQESVFIDVFFFGGSMGVFLAKKLVSMVQDNPDLHVMLMVDRSNPFTYAPEMNIAYNYLRAYSENFPEDRILIMPTQVSLKRTALPEYVDLIIDDVIVNDLLSEFPGSYLHERVGLNPKAKSDHSKIFVVDGLSRENGIAFVGSKNLTDSSGAISYDEVVMVRGPAVPIILDSYYYDMKEALLNDLGVDSFEAAEMLAPWDVMSRSSGGITRLQWPEFGDTTLQIGENNVYGTIRSPISQNIHLILKAKHQIIINEQLLFDPTIIRALKHALRNNKDLELYIILESLVDDIDSDKLFKHIPNNVFIDDLRHNNTDRVFIKWKSIPKEHLMLLQEVKASHGADLSPEYHLKGISIDGVPYDYRGVCEEIVSDRVVDLSRLGEVTRYLYGPRTALVSGSANKDFMSLSGGFREIQLVVFDELASAQHDCLFWSRWNDPDSTVYADPYDFELPEPLVSVIDQQGFLLLMKRLIISAYNFVSVVF